MDYYERQYYTGKITFGYDDTRGVIPFQYLMSNHSITLLSCDALHHITQICGTVL